MKNICLYFHIHQPFRLKEYSFFEIGYFNNYFDDDLNKEMVQRVAENCYLPVNEKIYETIQRTYGNFKVAFSISNTALQLFEKYAPNLIESFRKLAKTGCVEFLAEPENSALSSIKNHETFNAAIKENSQRIQKLFGQKSNIFRNTQSIYRHNFQKSIPNIGFQAVLSEASSTFIENQSPNRLFHSTQNPDLKILIQNSNLSKAIAQSLSDKNKRYNIATTSNFIENIEKQDDELVILFMDYETFEEQHKQSTDKSNFLLDFGRGVLANPNLFFVTPSEAIIKSKNSTPLNNKTFNPTTQNNNHLSELQGNTMQQDALQRLTKLTTKVNKSNNKLHHEILKKLQSFDYFQEMQTAEMNRQNESSIPYKSAHKAYINYMNILNDFEVAMNEME